MADYVEAGLDKADVRQYVLDNFGEEALDDEGNIKPEFIRQAMTMAQEEPEERKRTLLPALRAELSMSPSEVREGGMA